MPCRMSLARISFLLMVACSLFAAPLMAEEIPSATREYTIEKIECQTDKRLVNLVFSEGTVFNIPRMNYDEHPAISFSPGVNLYWYDSKAEGNRITLSGSFQPGTTYHVRIEEPLATSDPALVYRETRESFVYPDLVASVKFALPDTVIERDSSQLLHARIVNVGELFFESIQIPPLLAAVSTQYATETLNRDSAWLRGEYEKVQARLAGQTLPEEFKPFLGEVKRQSQLFFSNPKKNLETVFTIPLTFREEKEKGAFQWINITNNRNDLKASTGQRLFRITDISLMAKISPSDITVWAVSLRDGKPVEGLPIVVSTENFEALYLGATSSDGLLKAVQGQECPCLNLRMLLDDNSGLLRNGKPTAATGEAVFSAPKPLDCIQARALIASRGEDCAYLIPGRIKSQMPGISGISSAAPRSYLKGHVFTERGAYRPGEKIHLKATFRDYSSGSLKVPEGAKFLVKIKDPLDEIRFSKVIELNEYGTWADEYDAPGYSTLGLHQVDIFTEPGKEYVCSTYFRVEEFRPPRHYADIRFRREQKKNEEFVNREMQDDILISTIEGKYYAGGPVKHGQVRWKAVAASAERSEPGMPGYEFGYNDNLEDRFIESGESILNESGEVEFRFPLEKEILSGKHGIKIMATVVDFDGRAASTESIFAVTPEYRVGFEQLPGDIKESDPFNLNAVVLNRDGNPVQEGEIEARIYAGMYYDVLKRNESGGIDENSWERGWRRDAMARIPIVSGKASKQLEASSGGSYLLEVVFRASDGMEYASAVRFSVGYTGNWDWQYEGGDTGRITYNNSIDRLRILKDRGEYAIGDVMSLRFVAQQPYDTLLVTLEREGVREAYCLKDGQETLEIPITDSLAPNFYVSALGVRKRGEFPRNPNSFDLESPKVGYDCIQARVRQSPEKLQVEIAPELEKIQVLPGQEITLNLRTSDTAGNGIPAEVALAVVDEQALALTNYQTPDLSELLQYAFPLLVKTSDGHLEILLQSPFNKVRNEPLTGGGEGGLGLAMGITLRKDFNPTPYFNPFIHTDSQGHATVTVKFSEQMTLYRIFAIACDKGERFATAERPALAVKKFYFEPGLPNFLNKGDEALARVAAFNKTDQTLPASFQFESGPQVALQSPSQNYQVASFDRALIPLSVKALQVGMAEINMLGKLGEHSDGIQTQLPIHSGFPIQTENQFKAFRKSAHIQYEFPVDLKGLALGDLSPRDLSFRVTVSGSPFLKISSGFRYLLQYPYGCAEQTASGVLPLAALRSLIAEGMVPGISLEEADKFLGKGVERLLSMQTASGGFTYWPGQQLTDYWASMYAMNALLHASQSGIAVDAGRLAGGIAYLKATIDNPNNTPFYYRGEQLKELAAYLLAKAGELNRETYDRLVGSVDKDQREAQLFLLLAAKLSGFMTPGELRKQTRAALVMEPQSEEYMPFNAMMREPSVALLASALILEPTDRERADHQAMELLASMKSQGCWTSTSDTGWALLALGEHFRGFKAPQGEVKGVLVQQGVANKEFTIGPEGSAVLELDAQKFIASPDVSIELDAETDLACLFTAVFPRLDYAQSGHEEGFILHKEIRNTSSNPKVRVGDVVEVILTLDVEGDQAYEIALDDPLPGGFVAINSALANEAPAPMKSEEDYFSDFSYNGAACILHPNHSEMRHDRVLVFRNHLRGGSYQYSYFARAVCAGTFRIPSTRIEEMYSPENCAYTQESRIEILGQ